jgi:hypothetical protein
MVMSFEVAGQGEQHLEHGALERRVQRLEQ